MGMGYSPFQKGQSTRKFAITTETPPYEWDQTTTPDTTYIRYENTDKKQYIERVLHVDGRYEQTYALWTDKADPGVVWSPIAFDNTYYDV